MKEKLIHFLSGRYGTDDLNQFLFVLEIVLLLISLFTRNMIWQFLFYIVIAYYFYRTMSRNIVARSIENQKYVHLKTKIVHTFKSKQMDFKDRKYRHFTCPKCAQIIRVPKGKGKVEIKCPTCKETFTKKA